MKYICIITILSFVACEDTKKSEKVVFYYDLENQISNQIALLTNKKAEINKTVILDGKLSETSYRPDSAQWADELNLLLSIDINMPKYQGLYTQLVENDKNSNLKICTFSHQLNDNVRVPYIKIYYLENINEPKKIEGEFIEHSSVSDSYRKISVDFELIEDNNIMTGYEIDGYQKLLTIDSVTFQLSAKLK